LFLTREYVDDALALRPHVAIFVSAMGVVTSAKSRAKMLVVRDEAVRLAKDYPAVASIAELSEFIIRFAVRQRVPLEIG
jgi:hypothetical protein